MTLWRVYENGKPLAVEELSAVVHDRRQGRRGRVHVGPSRRDAAAEHRRPPRVPARLGPASVAGACTAGCATRSTPTAAREPEQERQAKDCVLRHRELAEVVDRPASGPEGRRADEQEGDGGAEAARRVEASPELTARYADAWDQVEAARRALPPYNLERVFFESGLGFYSEYFTLRAVAGALGRREPEAQRPAAARVHRRAQAAARTPDGFDGARLPRARDQARLTASMTALVDKLGATHPLVQQSAGGQSAAGPGRGARRRRRSSAMRRCARRCSRAGRPPSTARPIPSSRSCGCSSRGLASCGRATTTKSLGVERDAYAKIAQAVFAVEGDARISGWHLHSASVVRTGEGIP